MPSLSKTGSDPVLAVGMLCAVLWSGAGAASGPVPDTQELNRDPVALIHPPQRPLSAMAELGRKLFHDPRLSGSGRMSCAGCHDPERAYGPPGADAVMLGGPDLNTPGLRAVPSLRYLYRQPPFSIGPDASGDNDQKPTLTQQASRAAGRLRALKSADTPQVAAANLVPQGGLFWDGRVDTLQQQADGPMFNPIEMDAGDTTTFAAKLQGADYAEGFRRLFGAGIFRKPDMAVSEAMFAIARYEEEDQSFHPFSSKFDAWLAGRAHFTPAELKGYQAFNDPKRGNCAACHLDRPTRDRLPPLFTDFQYEALGAPRNAAIPANRDPAYFDLGVCGPARTDMQGQTQYCGMFLTPSLRNAAMRPVFFHNGVFHSLHEVLDWYVNRDLDPARFYPRDADGRTVAYDDLPENYRVNVDKTDAPFDRHPGDAPALSPAEMDDIIAFLKTLSDGYTPKPEHAPASTQKVAGSKR
ncbi:MAG TPA: cytochrome c peroxidase [Gammaproteobacteria bacterium]|nr:cytochrome c peroxidase [Gammaproteobacteria bacterium]